MYKLLIILVLMATQGSSALANQDLLKGSVKDGVTLDGLSGVVVYNKSLKQITETNDIGYFKIKANKFDELLFTKDGYKTVNLKVEDNKDIKISLEPLARGISYISELGLVQNAKMHPGRMLRVGGIIPSIQLSESYNGFNENKFVTPSQAPFSTFAIDVDGASYGNIRRMINAGEIPPKDAVRIEEMINYFSFDHFQNVDKEPVKIATELTSAPWNNSHHVMRIVLKAKDIPTDNLPPANFVFLIDISGSMQGDRRLPLVKSSLKLLVDQLRDEDQVAIVTYAGRASVHLNSIRASQKMTIKQAIDELTAGGSTAGGEGIMMAYDIARKNFLKNGNNRIILASDGDFNVGLSSDQDMEQLIAKERESGVHLTVLGFGMGNLKDSKMELLANKGHGNYAYIDNISAARKAMITEFGGTMFTVAKDVKVQVEFNPYYVQSYRLIGYENRLLEQEDFNNDNKIGGDMGVGHTVTAIYEIIPVGIKNSFNNVDPLKYQSNKALKSGVANNEYAAVKFRYKDIKSEQSKLQEAVVSANIKDFNLVTDDFRFASAVVEFGMLLRNSEFKQNSNFEEVIGRAKSAKGQDREGYRAEFIDLVKSAQLLFQANNSINLVK